MAGKLGLNILYVEDDATIRDALAHALEDEGYDVAAAADAEEGIRLLGEKKFHLIITDYWLPGKNGAWMIEEARSRGWMQDTFALIMTASQDIPKLQDIPVLRKPIDLHRFLRKVDELLAPVREKELNRVHEKLSTQSVPLPAASGQIRLELHFYISSASTYSLKAVRKLERFLAEYKSAQVRLRIFDLSRSYPKEADEDRIAYTPALVKRFPVPKTWLLGTLEDLSEITNILENANVERIA